MQDYLIRLRDGQQFKVSEVTKLESSPEEYEFYDAEGKSVMRVPKSNTAWIQAVEAVAQQPEKILEQNNVPPDETPKVMANAKRLAMRFWTEEYDGKLRVWDSDADRFIETDLEKRELLETVVLYANEFLEKKKHEVYDDGKPVTLKVTMQDVDSAPMMTIQPQHWQMMLARGDYRMVVLPCAEKGNEQYHVQATPSGVNLTRTVLRVEGGQRVEMQLPSNQAR